jgi:hypothetical protein
MLLLFFPIIMEEQNERRQIANHSTPNRKIISKNTLIQLTEAVANGTNTYVANQTVPIPICI